MKVFSYGEFQTSTETEPGVIVTHAVLASSARGRRRTHLRILSPAHPQDILKQIPTSWHFIHQCDRIYLQKIRAVLNITTVKWLILTLPAKCAFHPVLYFVWGLLGR